MFSIPKSTPIQPSGRSRWAPVRTGGPGRSTVAIRYATSEPPRRRRITRSVSPLRY
ncbi:Uncharacterised protein [Mycobacteroides abscessus subsp. abscessus]|nr:Uncharacterised protein [Mycobacteroides abscessus subsp. abscessus]